MLRFFRVLLLLLFFMSTSAQAVYLPRSEYNPNGPDNHLSFKPENQQAQIWSYLDWMEFPQPPPPWENNRVGAMEQRRGARALLDHHFYYLTRNWPLELRFEATDFYFEPSSEQEFITKKDALGGMKEFFVKGANFVDLDIASVEPRAKEADALAFAPIAQKYFRLRALYLYYFFWQMRQRNKKDGIEHYRVQPLRLIAEASFNIYAQNIIKDLVKYSDELLDEISNLAIQPLVVNVLYSYFVDAIDPGEVGMFMTDRLVEPLFAQFSRRQDLFVELSSKMSLAERERDSWESAIIRAKDLASIRFNESTLGIHVNELVDFADKAREKARELGDKVTEQVVLGIYNDLLAIENNRPEIEGLQLVYSCEDSLK